MQIGQYLYSNNRNIDKLVNFGFHTQKMYLAGRPGSVESVPGRGGTRDAVHQPCAAACGSPDVDHSSSEAALAGAGLY